MVPTGAGQSDGAGGGGLVLVVEDENLVLRVATDMLLALGYEVVAATDADGALTTFHRHRDRLSLVLLDLTVPGMDAAELLSALEGERTPVPIVLCSGYDTADVVCRYSGRRIAGFLQKPYRLEQMRATLHRALGAR
jgi:two-component system, cell cycle sensor histidine kinase and response regulator CckA